VELSTEKAEPAPPSYPVLLAVDTPAATTAVLMMLSLHSLQKGWE
jgi:hypothetical protein